MLRIRFILGQNLFQLFLDSTILYQMNKRTHIQDKMMDKLLLMVDESNFPSKIFQDTR
jgi:hypothetical protein